MRAYVLEDDPDIAALEADVLRDLGFTVVTCTRIIELGDLMEMALPHLLIVDYRLRHNAYCLTLDGDSYRSPKLAPASPKSAPQKQVKSTPV